MVTARKNTKVALPKANETEEYKAAQAGSTNLSTQALALTVTNDAEYEAACEFLITVKKGLDDIEEKRTRITAPLNAALRETNDLFRPLTQAAEKARNHLRGLIATYSDKKDQERRRLQAEADERARKERERIEKQAKRAEETGKVEKAEQLQQKAANVVAPSVMVAPPKAAGIRMVDTWKFEVTNPAKINAEYLIPDHSKIGDQVRAVKNVDEARRIIGDGVRVWCDRMPSTTGR